jgi:hypothetical protein
MFKEEETKVEVGGEREMMMFITRMFGVGRQREKLKGRMNRIWRFFGGERKMTLICSSAR